ncbi:MAG: sugar transferase, partial [Phenylobacterium sp.]
RPGLTGWAQIHGRDELPIPEKAELDREYLERMSIGLDLRIMAATALAAVSGRGVTH